MTELEIALIVSVAVLVLYTAILRSKVSLLEIKLNNAENEIIELKHDEMFLQAEIKHLKSKKS